MMEDALVRAEDVFEQSKECDVGGGNPKVRIHVADHQLHLLPCESLKGRRALWEHIAQHTVFRVDPAVLEILVRCRR